MGLLHCTVLAHIWCVGFSAYNVYNTYHRFWIEYIAVEHCMLDYYKDTCSHLILKIAKLSVAMANDCIGCMHATHLYAHVQAHIII